MTLRDLSNAMTDSLYVAATQPFWDWDLWLSVGTVIIVLFVVTPGMFILLTQIEREKADFRDYPIWAKAALYMLGLLCAFSAYDVWFVEEFFDDVSIVERTVLRIGFPLMAAPLLTAFLVSLGSNNNK